MVDKWNRLKFWNYNKIPNKEKCYDYTSSKIYHKPNL